MQERSQIKNSRNQKAAEDPAAFSLYSRNTVIKRQQISVDPFAAGGAEAGAGCQRCAAVGADAQGGDGREVVRTALVSSLLRELVFRMCHFLSV